MTKSSPTAKDGLRFDWYQPLDADFIDDLAAKVIATIEGARASTRGISKEKAEQGRQIRLVIAKHVLSALYSAQHALTKKKRPTRVSVMKTTSMFSGSKRDPTKIPYSFRHFMAVYNALITLKWINEDLGKEAKGYTRIYAINKLKATFKAVGLRWLKQQPMAREELIVLRDRVETNPKKALHHKAPKKYKKITLETPDTPAVAVMADTLYKYNEFLTTHCVSMNLPDNKLYEVVKSLADNSKSDEETEEENFVDLDLSRVQLRRIFSRADMTKGGRFYNGWWQTIPSIYRGHITIDGLKTTEVDYSSMSLRIIYAQKGIYRDPNEDLYDIKLDGWTGSDDPRRTYIKTFINALMNDDKGTYKLSKAKQKLLGITHQELKAKVLEEHKLIADQLTSGVGLNTQFLDSQIAELVMTSMMEDEILALPIHDSFRVRSGYRQWLETTMKAAFEKIVGGLVSVEADGSRLEKHFGMSKEQFKWEDDKQITNPSEDIYSLADLSFDALFKKTLMKSYIGGWETWRSKNT
ncbi:hypothetical protein N9161_08865 [Porticoccaceae bacterium]|nr:hypothetical protein [Porticoccaceae bacterium]